MTHYTLELPYSTPPLSSNRGMHKLHKARVIRELRETTRHAVLDASVPYLGRAHMELVWFVNSRHRRDADNVVPTLKAVADALVLAGVVDDDTPDLLDKAMPIIAYVPRSQQPASLWLVVWQLQAELSPLERLQRVYEAGTTPSAQAFAHALSAASHVSLGGAA